MIRKCSTAAFAALLLAGCAGEGKLFRTNEELAQVSREAPAATQPARVTQDAEVRSSPHELSPVLHRLPTGTAVLAAGEATRGWRRVRTEDGKSGYVRAAAVELSAEAEQAAGRPAEGAPPSAATR